MLIQDLRNTELLKVQLHEFTYHEKTWTPNENQKDFAVWQSPFLLQFSNIFANYDGRLYHEIRKSPVFGPTIWNI